MKGIEIVGTGSYVPKLKVTNDDLSKIVDTNDEWISTRTGIKERRISENENTSDLAAKAAIKALEDAGETVENIELLIVATTSPDHFVASTACIVQDKIGAVNAISFDVSAACSGFLYALNIAKNFVFSGQVKNALVIGAEVFSKIIDWKDRSTCVLFGDGAGAVVLQQSSKDKVIDITIGSQGDKWRALQCKTTHVESPYSNMDDTNESLKINMNGKEIFKFAVKTIVDGVKDVVKKSEYELEDIKYIVPHQANFRILDFAAKKLGINTDKFYMNLDKYGNTSAASVPLALDEMNKKFLLKKGDKIILIAFGGGLTWGYALLEW